MAFVAVNAEQAEDWNGASGQEFIDQRERHERMLSRLKARLIDERRFQDGLVYVGNRVTAPAAAAPNDVSIHIKDEARSQAGGTPC